MGTHHTAVGRTYYSAAWKMLRKPSVHSDGMRVLAWALVALWPHVAAATDWTLTDLGTLGGSISYGAAVSNGGYVAGCAELSTGVFHAFVYSNGTMRDLDPGGAAGSCAYAVNDDGVAAGRSASGEAVIWGHGGTVHLGVPGMANGINNAGMAVGAYTFGSTTHAFVFANGTFNDIAIGNPASFSSADDVNERGQVVVNVAGRAFLWEAGATRDLGGLTADGGASARSINDQGEVVGMSGLGQGPTAFIWSGGVMQALPGPGYAGAIAINNRRQVIASGEGIHGYFIEGATFTRLDRFKVVSDRQWHGLEPTGINDRGWIVGQGVNENNEPRGFLLIPIDTVVGGGTANPIARPAPGTRAIVTRLPPS